MLLVLYRRWRVRDAVGKRLARTAGGPSELPVKSGREVSEVRYVAVKCIDITRNSKCEGNATGPY